MAHDFARNMNPIQRERAERAGITPDSAQVDRQRMIAAGELPAGLNIHTVTKWDDETHSYMVWYQPDVSLWKIESTNKQTSKKVTLAAPTVQMLNIKIAGFIQNEQLDAQPTAVVFRQWKTSSKWGKLFDTIDQPATRTLLLEQLAENGIEATPK